MNCPWCGADGYDNVVLVPGDPIEAPRCGSCWNDVRTETIERLRAGLGSVFAEDWTDPALDVYA